MRSELTDKIRKLRDIYIRPEDQRAIDDLERNLRTLIAQSGIIEIESVQAIIKDSQKRIADISKLLSLDMSLSEADRKALDKERAVHIFWIERFGINNDQHIEDLVSGIDSKLNV